jgi:hypothetical protein
MRRGGRCAKFAMVLLASVGAGACAMLETRETKLQTVKTVGIISAVGDDMSFASMGLTAQNTFQRFPIESWGIDDLIVRQATSALNGRFQVQPVSYPRAAFAAIKDSSVAPVNLMRGDPFKKLVRTDVAPQGLDAYIVITRARSNVDGGARKVEGIGFVNYGTLLESYSRIHALYEIRVIDGKTFDVIEKMVAPPLDRAGGAGLAGPSLPVDANLSPDRGDPARNDLLRGAIADLIGRSLPVTLSDMHLAEVR